MLHYLRLFPVFVLLFVAYYATMRGIEILKVETFEMPFGSREVVVGSRARWAGRGLIALGIVCLALVIVALF